MRLWNAAQREAMDAAITRASAGTPTALVVDGDPGTGKTSFLDDVVDRAAGFEVAGLEVPAFEVLSADGLETGERAPFDLLAQWGVSLPETASLLQASQALRRRVDDVAGRGPVLLRADDLQWADPESVEALVALLSRASGDRLLIAVGSRPSTTHPGWRRWTSGRGRAVAVTLDGLAPADVVAICRELRPELTARTAAALGDHVGGNPLYLRALLAEYDAEDLSDPRQLPAPADFAALVELRTARLAPEAVHLLRAGAVLGSGWLAIPDIAELAGITDPAAHAQTLVDADLITHRNGTVRTRHALIRAAVLQLTPLPELRALHEQAASIVTDRAAVFEHRVAAAEQYDDALADDLETYAKNLHDSRSHRLAGEAMRSAARFTRSPQLRERRRLDAAFETVLTFDIAGTAAELDELAAAADRGRLAVIEGAHAMFERQDPEAVRVLQPAFDTAADPAVRYRLGAFLAWSQVMSGMPPDTISSTVQILEGLPSPDPALRGWVLFAAGHIASRTQRLASLLAGSGDLSERPSEVPVAQTMRLGWRGSVRASAGLFGPAIADLTEVTSRMQDGGPEFGARGMHTMLGRAHWFRGDWPLARINFRLAAELGADRVHPLVAAAAPLVDCGEGAFERADVMIATATELLDHSPWIDGCDALAVTLVVRCHADPSADRSAVYDRFAAGARELRAGRLKGQPWLAHAALAALWAKERDDAELCVKVLQDSAVHAPWVAPVVEWLHGLLAEEQGKGKLALAHLRAAAGDTTNDMPLYRAHMLADHARVAHVLGDAATATSSLKRAADLYASLGAAPYVARVGELLAGNAVSVGESGPVIDLTDRERDVLTLAAAGASYAQIARDLFITQSTVSYHLSNIYAKAGVGSRHALTELVRQEPTRFGVAAAL